MLDRITGVQKSSQGFDKTVSSLRRDLLNYKNLEMQVMDCH